jgi:transducin (beta)-like 1
LVGFELSTYALQQEARANKLEDQLGEHIPMGALVSLVQKGIQLSEMEAGVRKVDRPKDVKPYTLFGALPVLRAQIEDEKELMDENNEAGGEPAVNGTTTTTATNNTNDNDKTTSNNSDNTAHAGDRSDNSKEIQVDEPVERPIRDLVPMYSAAGAQCSQWSPMVKDILGMGHVTEGNATLINFSSTFASADGSPATLSLKHSAGDGAESEVTVLSWNYAGNFLITGSFDGQMKMWSSDGRLRHSLVLHKAPIMVVRWNRSGSLVLSMDCTNTVAIWDAFSGEIRQHFPGFEDPANPAAGTDADWIDGVTYAVTGENSSIIVYKVGERIPVLRFQGHTQAVNSINFDPSSQLLCSGSDDSTVRLWNGKTSVPVKSFYGHNSAVMCVCWITNNTDINAQTSIDPSTSLASSLVVSGSMDSTVRVWDANTGAALLTLLLHEGAVFYCEVSPNGQLMATGGLDGVLVVWDLSNIKAPEQPGSQRAIARYSCKPEHIKPDSIQAISSISWSSDSSKVFVSYGSHSAVLDLLPTTS